ncbi:hypothetical protein RS86_00868 [Microbacterium azadirachtae]|uniref:Uncharacterized protein n=1 Tax=Microbacterium azadirachtae TaxID=582680 RepID=A0A0F0LMD0_9MICO|nr:hypothetical protein RS86_00868 [Microbacterium azadirachtae]
MVLSKEQAADRYLGLVCQRNAANARIGNAFDAQLGAFQSGGTADVTDVKAAAVEAQRVNRLAIELIDDEYFTWPDKVRPQLQILRQSLMAFLSYEDGLVNSSDFASAASQQVPDAEAGAAAAQEIRYQLGLPADTTASCVGKETYTDTLHAAMVERNEYLASFKDKPSK